jgi:hypothetical protein
MAPIFTAHLFRQMMAMAAISNWFMERRFHQMMEMGILGIFSWPMALRCRRTMVTAQLETLTHSRYGFVGEHLDPDIPIGVHP